MKITDLRCAVIGSNPIVRIVTDEGSCGHGEIESSKPYMKPVVLTYKAHLLGEDPTNVERAMLKIRRLGAFKPWGSAVSAIRRCRAKFPTSSMGTRERTGPTNPTAAC